MRGNKKRGRISRSNKNKVINMAIIITIVIIGICSYNIYENYISEITNKEKYVEETMQVMNNKKDTENQEQREYEEIKLLKELQTKNDEIVGFITIDGTDIKYPITQGSDNDYYLYRNYEKEEDIAGSIFLDCKNTNDFNDINTILYGHNMKNGSMFANLFRYRDEEFLKNQPYINIFLNDRVLKYEIFSVYVTEPDYDYRTKFFDGEYDIEAFLDRITSKNEINTLVTPTINDKILTLSTCAYDIEDGRLAVHAILREEVNIQL